MVLRSTMTVPPPEKRLIIGIYHDRKEQRGITKDKIAEEEQAFFF